MRKSLLFTALLAATTTLQAQQIRPATSAQIYHEIAQLKNLTNVLYVAAHPDDENTRLLAWLVNDQNIRTAYLSLTRGDGGQNILGSEQGAALGLIRTHELMEARKLDGAEQFFTRAVDFGFSKTSDETFKHWNEYLLTHDATWIMRKFRPDVVICRFPPTAAAGHGQHAASAIIAAKAYRASGDKMQYTEISEYYPYWKPKRLLFNAYRFGSNNTTNEDMFKLEVGQYSPLLGMGFGELAGMSRSIHKSQGAGTPSVAGVQTEYFQLLQGDSLSKSLFDGIDITWNRVGRPEIGGWIDGILKRYDFNRPEASLAELLDLRVQIAKVKNKYWRTEKLEELDKVIMHCAGLMVEMYAKQPEATAGETIPFTLRVITRSDVPVKINSIKWMSSDTTMNLKMKNDVPVIVEHNITIPRTATLTQPYWLSQLSMDAGHYPVPQEELLGLPETPNKLNIKLDLKIGYDDFTVEVPLSYKKLDPTKGDVVEQLRIVPDASIDFNSRLFVTEGNGVVKAELHVKTFKNLDNAKLAIMSDSKLLKQISNLHLHKGIDTIIPVTLNVPGKEDFYLEAVLSDNGNTYMLTQNVIQYDHIPTLQYFTSPYAKVLRSNWKVTAKRIGYVEGAGDYIPGLLRAAGLQVDMLKPADFSSADKLKKYDAIITGIRAVNTEKQMAAWMPVLLQYTKNGGTLVMQYNTTQDMSTTDLGPYPFTMSHMRVTEENAKVDFIKPDHRLLNYPNKITDADFQGWVQERGLYFPSEWDSRYQPLFVMHDQGEDPLKGGTLYTKYGKGDYIYTSLSFFRQFPYGNKGAIRLFMNMISAGK